MSGEISRERTRNYLSQVKGAMLFKIGAILVSFLMVPLMLQYLGQERFGIWSTLLAIVSWITFFDLGVGNGLRNCVADTLSRNRIDEAAKYTASGYTLIAIIALIVLAFAQIAAMYVPWQSVFNTKVISESNLRLAVQISVFFVVLNLWLGLVTSLIGAVQKTAMIGLLQFLANLIVLFFVYLLAKVCDPSITLMATAYGFSFFLANGAFNIWFFGAYRELRPRVYFVRRHVNPLLSLGLRFFILQVSVLVIFTTDKILITQLLGPSYVVEYDVVYKLFSAIILVSGIVTGPLWSAYTDAFSRNDLAWIKETIFRQLIIVAVAALLAICLILVARPILNLWLGSDLNVAFSLIISMAALTVITVWNNVFAIFINGTGRITVQIYTASAGALLNIPLSIFLVNYFELGVTGIVLATCLSLLLSAVILPFQVRKLLA